MNTALGLHTMTMASTIRRSATLTKCRHRSVPAHSQFGSPTYHGAYCTRCGHYKDEACAVDTDGTH